MKAILLADSECTGLRPITCTRPASMIRILGKPLLGYTIDMLIKNGFDEVAVVTRYRSEDIEEYISDCDVFTSDVYCVEEESQGQLMCIKKISKNWSEPFVVMNCNSMCDIEINKVILFHKAINADITVVCSTVEDAGKYGIVNLNRNGSVECLYEKPEWNHTSSNLANTGIYVVNTDIIDIFSEEMNFSFSNKLLEYLLEKKKRVYGYQTESFWHSIEDISDIRKCVHDVMSHKIEVSLPESKNGVFAISGIPKGHFNVVPPVYFGKNVTVGHNCTIGPYTVIEDNVVIGDSSRIKKSLIMKNSQICGNCDIIGAVIGERCIFKRNTVCLEGSCVSDGCVIESGSTVSNNVFVWPEKNVSYRSVLTNNLREGKNEFDLICDDYVKGNTFTEITSERCCRLGEALGSSSAGGKVAIGYSSSRESKALAMAVLSGLISSGSKINDFGECFESQMQFYVSFCSLDSGIFISADKNTASIRFFGEYGLPLSCKAEREIETIYKKSDFRRAHGNDIKEIRDMNSVSEIYYGQLLALCGENIYGCSATVKSLNDVILSAVNRCFYFLGVKNDGLPEFSVDFSGRQVTAVDEEKQFISYEKLHMLCCVDAFEQGRNVCLPFEAPAILEKVSNDYNCKVIRTGGSAVVGFSDEISALARKSMWAYDGLCLVFNVMGIMQKKKATLHQLLNELPEYNFCSKVISCSFPHSRLSDVLDIRLDKNSFGARKELENGYLTLLRQDRGRHIRIIAEAETMEAAEEICAEVQRKINFDTIDNMTQ